MAAHRNRIVALGVVGLVLAPPPPPEPACGDGAGLVIQRRAHGSDRSHLWYVRLDGQSDPPTEGAVFDFEAQFSADGRRLYFTRSEGPGQPGALMRLELEGATSWSSFPIATAASISSSSAPRVSRATWRAPTTRTSSLCTGRPTASGCWCWCAMRTARSTAR